MRRGGLRPLREAVAFPPEAAPVDEFAACDHAGAVMVYDEPTCDPAMACWWPPQVALACEHTHYIITTRDVSRRAASR